MQFFPQGTFYQEYLPAGLESPFTYDKRPLAFSKYVIIALTLKNLRTF